MQNSGSAYIVVTVSLVITWYPFKFVFSGGEPCIGETSDNLVFLGCWEFSVSKSSRIEVAIN